MPPLASLSGRNQYAPITALEQSAIGRNRSSRNQPKFNWPEAVYAGANTQQQTTFQIFALEI